jgi:GT2 family glycosyltransferase
LALIMHIDIVIPVYNALPVLKKCINALIKNQKFAEKIIIINDGSTDVQISPYLTSVCDKNNWRYINHKENKGFVKTANEGLKLSENHTILLNSDTIVTSYWLNAFSTAVNANRHVGTITPWSNNAEICSFPEFLVNNEIIEELDTIGQILYREYKPSYPELPTAVGFCMLISQEAKQKVGFFDEKQFGHGYGEENDYSLRVKAEGLKNILCDNAYVAHFGNASFSDLGLKPSDESMKRLLEKHPDYQNTISRYITKNPLESMRREILNILKEKDLELYQDLLSL